LSNTSTGLHSVNSNRGHESGSYKKQHTDRLIRAFVFEHSAERAADQQRSDGGDRQEDVPCRADLTGHRMLLTDHRSQSVLGARDEKKRSRQQNDRNEERCIGHGCERKEDIEQGTDAAKQQHESAISHPERVPHIPDKSERERQVERNGRHEPEIRDLMRRQMQPVLEKETDWDIDQAS
jgi:hypothetical protein